MRVKAGFKTQLGHAEDFLAGNPGECSQSVLRTTSRGGGFPWGCGKRLTFLFSVPVYPTRWSRFRPSRSSQLSEATCQNRGAAVAGTRESFRCQKLLCSLIETLCGFLLFETLRSCSVATTVNSSAVSAALRRREACVIRRVYFEALAWPLIPHAGASVCTFRCVQAGSD